MKFHVILETRENLGRVNFCKRFLGLLLGTGKTLANSWSPPPQCRSQKQLWVGSSSLLVSEVELSQWSGHPPVLGIPIPKTLVIWASPSHLTIAIWVRVRVAEDAHITRVLGMGMPKTQGWPYHCNSAWIHTKDLVLRLQSYSHFQWTASTVTEKRSPH